MFFGRNVLRFNRDFTLMFIYITSHVAVCITQKPRVRAWVESLQLGDAINQTFN